MGVDMALTTTTGGALGLDADGSEWTFESKLTDYAEYPSSDRASRSARHHMERGVPCPVTGLEGGPWKATGSSSSQIQKLAPRPKKSQTDPRRRFCRSDVAAIDGIVAAANGGLALIGGWYVYVTLPYVYVAPIVGVGSCAHEFSPLLSYGGPSECDSSGTSCNSGKTIKDTMGDQGLAGMCDTAGLSGPSITASHGQSWTAKGCEAWA